MNLKRLAGALALLATGFGAGAWWMQARLAPEIAALETAASRSMVADLAALSGAMPGPALPKTPPQPRATPAANPVAPPAATSGAAPSASTRASDSRPLPPEVAELVGRLMSQDRDHDAQKRDPVWADAQEARIRELLARNPGLMPAGAEIGPIDCRTTTCRVRLNAVADDGKPGMAPAAQDIGTLFSAHDYGTWFSTAGARLPGTFDYDFYLRPDISKSAEPGAVQRP